MSAAVHGFVGSRLSVACRAIGGISSTILASCRAIASKSLASISLETKTSEYCVITTLSLSVRLRINDDKTPQGILRRGNAINDARELQHLWTQCSRVDDELWVSSAIGRLSVCVNKLDGRSMPNLLPRTSGNTSADYHNTE